MSARSSWFMVLSKSVESLTKLHRDIAALASILFGQVACSDLKWTLVPLCTCMPFIAAHSHKQIYVPDVISPGAFVTNTFPLSTQLLSVTVVLLLFLMFRVSFCHLLSSVSVVLLEARCSKFSSFSFIWECFFISPSLLMAIFPGYRWKFGWQFFSFSNLRILRVSSWSLWFMTRNLLSFKTFSGCFQNLFFAFGF